MVIVSSPACVHIQTSALVLHCVTLRSSTPQEHRLRVSVCRRTNGKSAGAVLDIFSTYSTNADVKVSE